MGSYFWSLELTQDICQTLVGLVGAMAVTLIEAHVLTLIRLRTAIWYASSFGVSASLDSDMNNGIIVGVKTRM